MNFEVYCEVLVSMHSWHQKNELETLSFSYFMKTFFLYCLLDDIVDLVGVIGI